jgi:hypothetical protein
MGRALPAHFDGLDEFNHDATFGLLDIEPHLGELMDESAFFEGGKAEEGFSSQKTRDRYWPRNLTNRLGGFVVDLRCGAFSLHCNRKGQPHTDLPATVSHG